MKIPNLRMLNLSVCEEEFLRDGYSFFADSSCQMHDGPWSTPEEWLANLPEGCRAVMNFNVANRDEAIGLTERLRGMCGPAA